MGSFPSSNKINKQKNKEIERKKRETELEVAHLEALEIVKYRIRDYNFRQHGSKDAYMLLVYDEFLYKCNPDLQK